MCLSCKKAKKRTDVMIFAEGEYHFENKIIKSTFAKVKCDVKCNVRCDVKW